MEFPIDTAVPDIRGAILGSILAVLILIAVTVVSQLRTRKSKRSDTNK